MMADFTDPSNESPASPVYRYQPSGDRKSFKFPVQNKYPIPFSIRPVRFADQKNPPRDSILNTSRGDPELRNTGKVSVDEGWDGETVRFAKLPGH